MPLPSGYTLDQPVKLPPGYSLDSPDSDAPPNAPGPAKPALPPQLARGGGVVTDLGGVTDKGQRVPAQITDPNTGRPVRGAFTGPSPIVQGIEQIAGAGTRPNPSANPRLGLPATGTVSSADTRTTGQRAAGGASKTLRGAGEAVAPVALPAAAATVGIPATVVGGITGTAAQQGVEHGAEALGAPKEYAELGGDVAGLAGGLLAGRGVNVVREVDPHVAALRAWGFEKDPRILDQIKSGEVKLTSGLSDLKTTGQVKGPYANESVLDALPAAKDQNRAAWNQWMMRARGQVRMGTPIIQETANALKSSINDPRAQAILDEAGRQYNQALTPDDLYRMLEEKNGELKSFYSQSKEVQAAAERAGADTLKNRALLEAQARAIRNLLYQTLDPEGRGAGPAEIQGRYGALKAIEEAANARRTGIIQEHPVNPLERAANIHLDPRAAIKARQGSSEWLIEKAINAAPNAGPLPTPSGMYPTPMTGPSRQLPSPRTPYGVSGVTAPDLAGQAQRGTRQMMGVRQLEAGPQPAVGGPRLQGAGIGSGPAGSQVNIPPAQPMDTSIPPPVNRQRAAGPQYGGTTAHRLGKAIVDANKSQGAVE